MDRGGEWSTTTASHLFLFLSLFLWHTAVHCSVAPRGYKLGLAGGRGRCWGTCRDMI